MEAFLKALASCHRRLEQASDGVYVLTVAVKVTGQ